MIVDTDGGIDDFRAICMLLASPDVEIIAFTCTDGVLSPDSTWSRLTSLLHGFGHEGIPVGTGRTTIREQPDFRKFAASLPWVGNGNSDLQQKQDAAKLIKRSVELEVMPVDFVALGPLGNLDEAVSLYPGLDTCIRNLYWFRGSPDKSGFNYRMDPGAAKRILGSGLKIDMILSGEHIPGYDGAMLEDLQSLQSVYADAITGFYAREGERLPGHLMSGYLSDDLVPLYLLFPEKFEKQVNDRDSQILETRPGLPADFPRLIYRIFDSNREDKNVVFKTFPTDDYFFEDDVKPVAGDIIARHGLKEWKLVVLTNEFHEHLGIYSIVGAKMGLRAREYFNVGIDELVIGSHAGSDPPLSCLNDGLQVSTGATLGHGTITLDHDQPVLEATFRFKDRTVTLSLKEEILSMIRKDIREAIDLYGPDSTQYWLYVRELAIRYWLDLDRKDIFTITPG